MARSPKTPRDVAASRDVRIKRVYEPSAKEDGSRVLVDRLWPRGITKASAAVDVWLKDVAPSSELRRWFGHDPTKWQVFGERYRTELATNPAMGQLRDLIKHLPPGEAVTLVFSARDEAHNQAVVLLESLLNIRGSRPAGSTR